MSESGQRKTAVFTCELRDDLGFAAPLLCIADELVRLAAQGGVELRTVFILSDPVYCGHEVGSHGHLVLPAPPTRRPHDIVSLGKSYAGLLSTIGFAEERELKLHLEAWDRLLAVLSPDLIVADNSPTVCLAARGRIPLLVTGSAFSAPPSHTAAFPALRANAQAETNQSLIRDVINAVLTSRGATPLANLPEILAGDRRAVFGVPQLDPYREYRNERLLAPCIDIKGPLAETEAPSVFLAVPSTLPQLTRIGRALERAGAFVYAYVPGPRSVGSTLLKQIGARIFATRPLLKDVFPEVSVVLAASADLALAAYLAGRPQALLQVDLETSLMALELEKRHTAIGLEITSADRLTYATREMIDNRSYWQSSREEARRAHAVLPSENSAALAATVCLELMGAGCSLARRTAGSEGKSA